MRPTRLALSLLVAFTGVAAAQPTPGSGPVDPDAQPPQVPPPQPPQPPPQPQPVPPPVVTEPVEMDHTHPEGLSIGIGLGYLLPTSLETPNVTSIRFRLGNGLTIEPLVTFARTSVSTDSGVAGAPSTTDANTELGITGLIRFPLISRHKFDLELLGSLGVDEAIVDPEGDNNNVTTTTISLNWGLAVAYWITPHWELTFTGSNPLISRVEVSNEQANMIDMSTTTTSFGLIFNPTVAVMIHVYN
jgi:hypothetical protein